MKLVGSYSCPFVRKISVILLEKNLPFTLVHAVDSTLSTAISPLGCAPVLIDAQGETHCHPPLIADYLEWLQPEPALLHCIAERMEQNLELLASIETWDNGKPIRETLAADVPLAIDHFRYFASCIRAQEA